MAVTFDAVGPSSAGQTATAATTTSWSHTCSGSERLLIAVVASGAAGSSNFTASCTYNGVAMTSVGSARANNDVDGIVHMFRLIAPAAGTNTVQFTTNNPSTLSSGSVSFNGVDQTTPLGTPVTAFGSSATPSVTVTGTTAGNMAIDGSCAGNSYSASTQTMRWRRNTNTSSGGGNGCSSTAAAGGSVTLAHTITSDWWGSIGVEVLASAGSPPVVDSIRIPIQTIRVP